MKIETLIKLLCGLVVCGSFEVVAWAVEEPKTLSLKNPETKTELNKDPLGIFQKIESALTSDEQIREDFFAALKLMQRGAEVQAEEKLLSILNRMPEHLKSRAELSNLYLRHHRDREAELLLEEGLKQSENYPDFLKLQALIYERRNEPARALETLSRLPITFKNDKQIAALFAHLYQQSGQYNLAKSQYTRLLQLDPGNPTWLLGLSIALDSEGEKKAAIEIYKRLQSSSGLNPEVSQYVEDRLKALRG